MSLDLQVQQGTANTAADDAVRQLEDKNRLCDELVSAVSHDMRSPVGAINIFCEILMSNSDALTDNQRQSIRMIAEAAAKLSRIIDDTVEIARLHALVLPLRWSTVDCRELLQHTMHEIRPIAENRGLRISEMFSAIDPHVFADADCLEQMILLMIGDAAKCAQDGSELQVTDENRDGQYILRVETVADEARCRRHMDDAQKSLFNKGRLGVRTPGESRLNWQVCEKLAMMLAGNLYHHIGAEFTARLTLPVANQ